MKLYRNLPTVVSVLRSNICILGLDKLECRRKEHSRADARFEAPGGDIGNRERLKQICYDFSNAKETLGFNEAKDISLFFPPLLLGQK